VQECFEKLQEVIVTAGKSAVRGETSPAKVAKVKEMEKAANEVRLKIKKIHSNKKGARQGRGGSDY